MPANMNHRAHSGVDCPATRFCIGLLAQCVTFAGETSDGA